MAADLKSARRLSGFTNRDVACLLDVDAARISRLEKGRSRPSGRELAMMALVYGRPIDTLLPSCQRSLKEEVEKRLGKVGDAPESWVAIEARSTSLASLKQRLSNTPSPYHELA